MNDDPRVFISAHELQAIISEGLLDEDDLLAVLPRHDQQHAILHFRAARAGACSPTTRPAPTTTPATPRTSEGAMLYDEPRKRRYFSILWRVIPAVVRAWLKSLGIQPGDTILLLVGKHYADAEIQQAVEKRIAAGKNHRVAFEEAGKELEVHPRTVSKRYARLIKQR